jgi:molybdate transport system substrate-binding protein
MLPNSFISEKVKVVATAYETTHKPIVYHVAVIKNSKNTNAANYFIQFFSGNQAKAVFEK